MRPAGRIIRLRHPDEKGATAASVRLDHFRRAWTRYVGVLKIAFSCMDAYASVRREMARRDMTGSRSPQLGGSVPEVSIR
jgi:hypothetical protein